MRRFVRQVGVVARLSFNLFLLVIRGSPMWAVTVVRVILFSAAISPALASSVAYWFRRVRKNVSYGDGVRQLVDIYDGGPGDNKPVVVFVTGGAWIIGYKAWAVPLGRALAAQGVLVVAPDYRNCPQARVDGMLEDVDRAVAWTKAHAAEYGGDPSRLVLCGQSAGAHLCALLLLRKAQNDVFGSPNGWRAADVLGFIGISGPYHLEATSAHWIARGFNRAIFGWVFGPDLERHSPADEAKRTLARLDATSKVSRLLSFSSKFGAAFPRVCLIHGTADQSAPYVTSELLEARLRLLGVRCEPTRKYKDWTHTDAILERPFAGDHTLHADIYDLIHRWSENKSNGASFDASGPDCARLAPQFLLNIGRFVNPF